MFEWKHNKQNLFFSTLAQCPVLMDPANGTVVLSGRSSGDTATYSCDSADFDLVGTAVRTCGDDGMWSGEAPMCIRK